MNVVADHANPYEFNIEDGSYYQTTPTQTWNVKTDADSFGLSKCSCSETTVVYYEEITGVLLEETFPVSNFQAGNKLHFELWLVGDDPEWAYTHYWF